MQLKFGSNVVYRVIQEDLTLPVMIPGAIGKDQYQYLRDGDRFCYVREVEKGEFRLPKGRDHYSAGNQKFWILTEGGSLAILVLSKKLVPYTSFIFEKVE